VTLSNDELVQVKQFSQRLRNAHVRGVVLISGDKHWAQQCGASFLTALDDNCLWIGDGAPNGIASDIVGNARHYLGQDRNTIVFNCHCGFHPDGFGALTGAIVGGGTLVLLAPSMAVWATYQDPDYQRITAHNTVVSSHNFIQRIISKLTQNKNLWHIDQGSAAASPPVIEMPALTATKQFMLTSDQQVTFEAVKKAANGRAKRPLVITSDRGRGKSTVLGLAAADLLRTGFNNIAICAPSLSSVDAVFSYAQSHLADFTLNGNTLSSGYKQLFFMPPDELLRHKPDADIVLVDEAAAIPVNILKAILLHYPRVVFATTVHGYEGNGRGFAIRFKQTLDELCPQWRRVFLQQPVRWAEDDFVEPLVADLLLLNAIESVITEPFDQAKLQLRLVSGAELVASEKKLSELFGLLVQAHYRTSPDDLRLMLDGPNIKVFLAVCHDAIVGAALVSTEGNIESQLQRPIEQCNRRVAGHLAPQMLAAQAGIQNILSLRCWRVMRIAVHPDLRRHTIGRVLLDAVFEKAKVDQQDYVATSFAATVDVFCFWQDSGFGLQHIGWRRDSVSGAHTALMTKSISSEAVNLFNQHAQKLATQLTILLRDTLSDLDADIAIKFIRNVLITNPRLSADDRRDVMLFVNYQRNYETCIAALSNVALLLIMISDDQKLCELVVVKVLQHKSWQQAGAIFGYKGKDDVISDLKQAYKTLLK
jgi:tRNA(Met) cytidine acetyltransferase